MQIIFPDIPRNSTGTKYRKIGRQRSTRPFPILVAVTISAGLVFTIGTFTRILSAVEVQKPDGKSTTQQEPVTTDNSGCPETGFGHTLIPPKLKGRFPEEIRPEFCNV